MKLSLPKKDLIEYIENLILANFPDGIKINSSQLRDMVENAILRTEVSFQNIEAKYYLKDGAVYFNHLNADHMIVLLYFAANPRYKLGYEINLIEKIYNLNKRLHSIDLFYSINLPEVFCVVHPLGSILGNAKYGNYMCIYQGVTIGSTKKESYPEFGNRVILCSNSSVIGKCKVGNNIIFATNSFVLNKDIPDNSIVVGRHPNVKIMPISKNQLAEIKVEVIFKNSI